MRGQSQEATGRRCRRAEEWRMSRGQPGRAGHRREWRSAVRNPRGGDPGMKSEEHPSGNRMEPRCWHRACVWVGQEVGMGGSSQAAKGQVTGEPFPTKGQHHPRGRARVWHHQQSGRSPVLQGPAGSFTAHFRADTVSPGVSGPSPTRCQSSSQVKHPMWVSGLQSGPEGAVRPEGGGQSTGRVAGNS